MSALRRRRPRGKPRAGDEGSFSRAWRSEGEKVVAEMPVRVGGADQPQSLQGRHDAVGDLGDVAPRHRPAEHETVAADLLHYLAHGAGDVLGRSDQLILEPIAVVARDLAQRAALGQKALERALLSVGAE